MTRDFHVTGIMTCGLCAKAIEKRLRGLDGVYGVETDDDAGRVRVIASRELSASALETAIEDTGSYEAELVGVGAKNSESR